MQKETSSVSDMADLDWILSMACFGWVIARIPGWSWNLHVLLHGKVRGSAHAGNQSQSPERSRTLGLALNLSQENAFV